MSSRNRNFRRRAGDDEDDDGEANGTVPPSTTTKTTPKVSVAAAASSKPKKPSQPAPKKLLSFADDEDTESPVPPRPSSSKSSSISRQTKSSSHKHTASRDRLSHGPASFSSNVQPQAGAYTKEALLELQKNTKTLASSRPSHSLAAKTPASEPVIVLKGLLKSFSQSDPIANTLKEIDELDDDEGKTDGGDRLFRREKDDAATRLASIGITKLKDSPGSSFPDQATIDAIRAKRERLRTSRTALPDYIALDAGSNHGEAEGLSDEEPEFRGRIGFIGDNADKGKKGVFEDVDVLASMGRFKKDNEVDEDVIDEDEEDKIWEEEQFRKAVGAKRMDDGSGRVTSPSVSEVQSVQQQQYAYPSQATLYSSMSSTSTVPNVGGMSGLDTMSISQQAELAKKALNDNLRRFKDSHARTIATLTRTDENLTTSLLNITALEKSLFAADQKFVFMQKLCDYVSIICSFLQHKAPFIEEFEEQLQKLHEERATSILERRSADNEEEMVEVEAAVNAAMSILKGNGGIEKAISAAQEASTAMKEQKNLPQKLDELGRDMNLQKRMDKERRAEARERRRARADSKRKTSMDVDGSNKHVEGESSTDESDSETAAYQSNREMLLHTAEQVFSDTAEEYSELSSVIERLETWKKKYPSCYRDAYMSLSAPSIFSPFVRLELLKWDPLHEDVDFISMNWHSLLYNYGVEDEDNISPDDADANLVPQLVEKVAIPILHHEIAHCWDMLSTRETKNAVLAADMVLRYVPASSEALLELVADLRERLADGVSKLMVPTWSPVVMQAVPNAARLAAHKFGMSVRLMRNICMWNKIIALPVLEKLALDELLNYKILPHLRSIQSNLHDAITRTERVVASLHGVWTGPQVTGQCSPKLQPFVDYLLTLGKKLEKRPISESGTIGLARKLKKMLVELNEYNHARDIVRTFNLKEAL
ncbi:transcriptional repressor ILP1 [Impatiens glandulifera]|uniref:transcriptional repressor ILP1 n=1 Tax=Impatiens glandulifera TaxID=253017 RepID=UPI001FB120C2|nr:transcriptional repressor ILP1 [Impatiens glandulifera]